MKKSLLLALSCVLLALPSCAPKQESQAQAAPKKEIGVQLYSVRDAIRDEGFDTVIKELAGMGYTYVEEDRKANMDVWWRRRTLSCNRP